MIDVSSEAEVVPRKPLPKGVLRISPLGPSREGKTCTLEEFPVEGCNTYYLSSVTSAQLFLARYPTLEVTPMIVIAPCLLEALPQLLTAIGTYHPEAFL